MNIKSIEEALSIIEESASIHAKTMETGDYKVGNKHFAREMKALVYVYKQGHLADLEKYLTSEDIGIRSFAAWALLPIMEERSKDVLQEIAGNDAYRITAFNAEMTLKLWGDGEIIFPYQEGWHW